MAGSAQWASSQKLSEAWLLTLHVWLWLWPPSWSSYMAWIACQLWGADGSRSGTLLGTGARPAHAWAATTNP